MVSQLSQLYGVKLADVVILIVPRSIKRFILTTLVLPCVNTSHYSLCLVGYDGISIETMATSHSGTLLGTVNELFNIILRSTVILVFVALQY